MAIVGFLNQAKRKAQSTKGYKPLVFLALLLVLLVNALAILNLGDASLSGRSLLVNGWKPIHVFYGDEKHLRAGSNAKSQCNQDMLVHDLLQKKTQGYFIDLAANDATVFSNSYQLEKQFDWNGLCFEPNDIDPPD